MKKRLAWILLAAPASGIPQDEHPNMPYMPGTGFEVPILRGDGPPQVNVGPSGGDIVGDAANEPSMWIDPANPNRIAIGWRQFDNVASDFRQAGFSASTDGGLTWNPIGIIEPGVFRSDPVLFGKKGGDFYYSSLFTVPGYGNDIWRSTNSGSSWSQVGQAFGGDKQWTIMDNTGGPGDGVSYNYWDYASAVAPMTFARSESVASNWTNLLQTPSNPYWGTIDVDLQGRLYLSGGQASGSRTFRVHRSDNAYQFAATPTFPVLTSWLFTGQMKISGNNVNPVGLTGQVNLAVDKSLGPTSGNVYVLCSTYFASNGSVQAEFTRSTNAALTFSTPIRVNTDSATLLRYHWQGALAVAPNGRVDATWLDTRNATNNSTSELFYRYSMDGGVTWSNEFIIAPAFAQGVGYPVQQKLGDYNSLISHNNTINVAFAATYRQGQDIYFLRRPAPVIPISGRVFFNDFVGDYAGRILQYSVSYNGNQLQSGTVPVDAQGSYSFNATEFVAGNYDLVIKGTHWLAKKVQLTVNSTSGTASLASLTNGDCDGDNEVGPGDFAIFAAHFGGQHDPADLDGDGEVGPTDFSILSAHFGAMGDE